MNILEKEEICMNLVSKNISNLIFASLTVLVIIFLFTALPYILVFGMIAWAGYKLCRFFGHGRKTSTRVHYRERERTNKVEEEVIDDFSYPESEVVDVDYTEIK